MSSIVCSLDMTELSNLGKFIIFGGILLIAFGLLLIFAGKISWLGKLPGDIYIQKKNFSFYFPLGTSFLISIILSFILWLLNRR
ncbi:MAG: DUF2905 domain-containing protein [Candidatus Omnitrophota bacterium]|nr:DUF2905 domain-containing protein [Candidatus Omnitrophota bacterium]